MSHRKIGPSKRQKTSDVGDGDDEKERMREVGNIGDTYKFVERRELTVKHADDLSLLCDGGLYAAQLLKMSCLAESDQDGLDMEDINKPDGVLKLPSDGGIFHDGIPFHHFSLTALQPKHIRRLKKNGIEIKQRDFSYTEDKQIRENWHSFATAHQLEEDDAPRMMSAATATEAPAEHKERIRFIRASLFRPWMCSRLLDRTAGQVFRRCYHLFHVSTQRLGLTRLWTAAEDGQLLELFNVHGSKWEFIGNELLRARFDCHRRHTQLLAEMGKGADGGQQTEREKDKEHTTAAGRRAETNDGNKERTETAAAGTSDDAEADVDMPWTRVEIARLYEYLCDHLPRMPVLVALIPRYQNMDSEIDWTDPAMRLAGRSAHERRGEWERLKAFFQSVRDENGSNVRVKDILRAVLPEDTRILARGRVDRRGPILQPSDHAKWVDIVREFCEEHSVEQPKNMDRTKLKQKLKSSDVMFHFSFRSIWRRFRLLLFIGRNAGLFRMLPIDEDRLIVHLRLLVFILQHIAQMNVRKRALRKYTRRFLRICGWPRRERIVLVDKAMRYPSCEKLEQMRAEERQTVVSLNG